MSAYWPTCRCGRPNGWRYYLADGTSGWRCLCGAHKPDKIQIPIEDTVTVELPTEVKT